MFNFLSRGDLEVVLDKFQFSPGDTISGKVMLKLKKQMQANKLTVSVTGEKIYTRTAIRGGIGIGINIGNGVQNNPIANDQTKIDKIFNFELPLDGSKEYNVGEYPFSIKLPSDVTQQPTSANSNGTLGTVANVVNAMNSLTGGMTVRTEWFVEAQLDIPGAIDMRKKVIINVA